MSIRHNTNISHSRTHLKNSEKDSHAIWHKLESILKKSDTEFTTTITSTSNATIVTGSYKSITIDFVKIGTSLDTALATINGQDISDILNGPLGKYTFIDEHAGPTITVVTNQYVTAVITKKS